METDKPLVSLVIPVYNLERYLKRCVESVLHQTFPNLEVILVDDGSTDKSPAMCDAYQKADNRVTVLHQKNQGLSAARNAGTAAASGEYIAYVDGDDYIHPEYVSTLLNGMLKNRAQISVCGFRIVGEAPAQISPNCERKESVYSKYDALSTMLYQKKFDVSAWGKMFQTEDIRRFPFPVGKVYEDILSIVQAFGTAERVAWNPSELYFYYQREESIVHSEKIELREDEIEMTDCMYDYVKAHCPQAEAAARCKKFSNYCQVLKAVSANKEAAQNMREHLQLFLQNNAPKVLRDSQARFKNRAAALLIMISPKLIEKL
ncbi:glycosyltransferase [Butyricicoccus faecihominis]|uniref:glycosyltransferase family 2 protein n=1 Tax=Butyricicoccus faecihominis TaxID=1712515 RepID=UPI00247845E7|nr:glycosyltransferase [Butyricicoccus faecihominis]MCQ5131146.1 glycosyltransferase [Butyricicoccus faecihominis]